MCMCDVHSIELQYKKVKKTPKLLSVGSTRQMEGSGVHKHVTLTTRSRPLLDDIKWVCLCVYVPAYVLNVCILAACVHVSGDVGSC